jgi:nicotinamidase-related amidase
MVTAAVQSSRTALVIIDMQNDFVHRDGAVLRHFREHGKGSAGASGPTPAELMVRTLQTFIEACRNVGVLIIWVLTRESTWTESPFWKQQGVGACVSDWGSELYNGLRPMPDEPQIFKYRHSAFFGTELETVLRLRKIETLMLAGVGTPYCVESTARDAFARDFRTIVLADCTATRELHEHEDALRRMAVAFGEVASSVEIMDALLHPAK